MDSASLAVEGVPERHGPCINPSDTAQGKPGSFADSHVCTVNLVAVQRPANHLNRMALPSRCLREGEVHRPPAMQQITVGSRCVPGDFRQADTVRKPRLPAALCMRIPGPLPIRDEMSSRQGLRCGRCSVRGCCPMQDQWTRSSSGNLAKDG